MPESALETRLNSLGICQEIVVIVIHYLEKGLRSYGQIGRMSKFVLLFDEENNGKYSLIMHRVLLHLLI